MSKFHSTVSRRTFMKGLGIGAAGLGAAAAAAPVFHDLDEAVASPASFRNLPWYVKDVDEPTIEIDWSLVNRFDQSKVMNTSYTPPKYIGQEVWDQVGVEQKQRAKQYILENKPGFTLKDYQLNRGGTRGIQENTVLGPGKAKTPEQLGVPRYEGAPEENARMLRAFMKYVGASDIGFLEMNDRTKKLIYTISRNGFKQYVFRDVDRAEETDTEFVIPNKLKWTITYSVPMSIDCYLAAQSHQMKAGSNMGYLRGNVVKNCTQDFLRGLGYQGMGANESNGIGPQPAFGTMAGLAEMCRYNTLLTPYHGSIIRAFTLITDLPLAPTKPIDAGIFRFCHSCKRCAESCPTGSIPFDDPSWEVPAPYSNPGKKAWYWDAVRCNTQRRLAECDCAMCMGACTFTKKNAGSIHELVAATLATTPIFNSFFYDMDSVFGYGQVTAPMAVPQAIEYGSAQSGQSKAVTNKFNPLAGIWWDTELPVYGFDTTIGTKWLK